MRYLFIPLVFISFTSSAQLWKSFIVSPRGDTLNRVDQKGKKWGPWAAHVDELRGERGFEEEGYYDNDQKTGTWKKYSLEGVKIAEENYSWGKLNGKQQYFTYNGGLLREEMWRAMDPKKSFDTVAIYDLKDGSKILDRVVVKNEGVSLKHGRWVYYDPREGRIEATERYVMNKLRTDEDEFINDDDIKPISVADKKAKSDTTAATAAKKLAKPQAILDYEKKNSGKKSIKARDGATGYIPEP